MLRSEGEVAALLAAVYDPAPDSAVCLTGLREVAMALEKAELGRAMIAALQMRLGEIPEDAMKRLARTDGLLKYNFNPLQPRDRQGRWSAYSSGGVMPVRAERSRRRGPALGGRAWERFPNAEFRNRLATAEGNADKPDLGYGEVRQSTDALGRYQMTREARRAAGMIDADAHWTGKYGVHSRAQFLAYHAAQENALTDYLRDIEPQLRANGSFDFIGRSVDGLRDRFTITRAGLIAASHREGAPRTRRYLSRIKLKMVSQVMALRLLAKSLP